MKHELIDLLRRPRPRIAGDGMDPLETLRPGMSAEEIVDALIRAAGKMVIAETRVW